MLKNLFKNYSTCLKKKEFKFLIEKMKDYKFYCDCKIYPCHCLNYGEPCKLYYNKDVPINFAKHLLYLNIKKEKQQKSNAIYNKHLNQWCF